MGTGLCELTARAVHGDPCHVLLAGILLLILDGDLGAMRFSAATGFFLSRNWFLPGVLDILEKPDI